MKEIQQWTAVICLAALTVSLAQSLLPSGTMERMGKFIVGAFMICVMIAPIAKFAPLLRSSFTASSEKTASQSSALESTMKNQVAEASQKSITNLVTAELSRIRVKCKNVRTVMDTEKDGRISITKVIVTLDAKDAAAKQSVQEYLEKELGLKTEVVTDGG
jgi:stage III sporulation protein AF